MLLADSTSRGGGGSVGAVRFLADSTSRVGGGVCVCVGGGAVCLFSADSTSEGGGGAVCLLSADSTSEGGGVLSTFSQFSQWGVHMYVNFYYEGGGGGGEGAMGISKVPEMRLVLVAKMSWYRWLR